MSTTDLWAGKPYWFEADNMAYKAYQGLAMQIKKRDVYEYTQAIPLHFNYCKDVLDTNMCIDFILNIQSSDQATGPDNLGFCLAADDHAEIEIITLLPKGYKVKSLKKNNPYHFDLLNVIRHEIEHVFQTGDFKIKDIVVEEHDRSEDNFLLDPFEIPAYVHGFRIASSSKEHFSSLIKKFIEDHGSRMKLPDAEIKRTIKIWNNYLNNLSF